MGKVKKQRKHAKTIKYFLKRDILKDTFPPSTSPNIKTNNVIYAIIEAEDTISSYFYLTGRFPQHTSRGNWYLIVDTNSILEIPIKIAQLHQWLMLGKN